MVRIRPPSDRQSHMMLFLCTCIHTFPAPALQKASRDLSGPKRDELVMQCVFFASLGETGCNTWMPREQGRLKSNSTIGGNQRMLIT